eukprot:scaffold342425_cov20-Prasinocladus_malaysianus.AAC.4
MFKFDECAIPRPTGVKVNQEASNHVALLGTDMTPSAFSHCSGATRPYPAVERPVRNKIV